MLYLKLIRWFRLDVKETVLARALQKRGYSCHISRRKLLISENNYSLGT